MRALKELIDLVVPSRCAICDRAGADLCEACNEELELRVREEVRNQIRMISVADYDEKVSKLLVAFKDKSQSSLSRVLAKSLSIAIDHLPKLSELVYLVPAPSRSENFALRGYVPGLLIVQQLVRLAPSQFATLDCLRFLRSVRDQVGLDSSQRQQNLRGAMMVNQPVAGRVCVVVDDVITTGATTTEAHRALSLAGAIVPCVLAFSSTAG
jgi:ComF family protein